MAVQTLAAVAAEIQAGELLATKNIEAHSCAGKPAPCLHHHG